MIRILAHDKDNKISSQLNLTQLSDQEINHYWLDLSAPDDDERKQLKNFLPVFHRLTKENEHHSNRPQLKLFKDYYFVSLQVISPNTLKTHELYLYVGKNSLVTFHTSNLKAVNDIWHGCRSDDHFFKEDIPDEILRRLMSRLVEQYIMAANDLEDKIDDLDLNAKRESINKMNRRIFQLRSELLSFRRVIAPLMDITNRMIGSSSIEKSEEHEFFLRNLNDNLSRITHMIESNLEITSDIRDSYLSLTTYRTNRVMQTLTVITTIFMPLTFIVGIYGMNFAYMPELNWRYGYFFILVFMGLIAIIMYYWFRKKGWFDK
ncbi:magnesium/cobalt transporter CorA [Sporolactobacillus shoreicorticis]|uniref:Magnesium transport protein CorA n=1 Tax=Sporolactobacillus shoreicorticis TaxID=1923877 RepID=A0ABW5S683_9BACL|nr:magnesium/cobalt transporter CorA [Sporolactobacillus shoreicorticis]MCO7125747.1 magnesium/cobalt transporter CorA [Sporolactobacillus shoreicorticis]